MDFTALDALLEDSAEGAEAVHRLQQALGTAMPGVADADQDAAESELHLLEAQLAQEAGGVSGGMGPGKQPAHVEDVEELPAVPAVTPALPAQTQPEEEEEAREREAHAVLA